MGILDFLRDASNVADALETKWEPSPAKTEREYEEQIYRFLNERFSGLTFRRQHRHAATTADLYVEFPGGGKAAIEVKANLARRPEFHRLVGQCYEYLAVWGCDIVVVLCGDTDPELGKLVPEAVERVASCCGHDGYSVVRA